MSSALRLTPSLRERVWGRTQLAPWFPNSQTPIGEAWFLAAHELPLLVKLIFTSERLSVQLHPDDGEAGERGKTEMWHILEADPGATIALGFREPISRQRLREAACSGEIEGLLNWIPVKPGETYFTPAHTVHAIGAGIVLCEIQQNSDVTYRLWDYGRPRPIHLEEAIPIAELGIHPGAVRPVKVADGFDELVRAKHFVTQRVCLRAGERYAPQAETSQLWITLDGCGTIGGEPYQRGEVWLMPERGDQPAIAAVVESRFLRTWAPR
jgi:mannose-6-phosphate isomerase